MQKKYSLRWLLLIPIMLIIGALFAIGFFRLTIDTDVVSSLPKSDPVVVDAQEIFKNHPIQDQVVINVSIDKNNPELLANIADDVEARLKQSNLFKEVGMKDMQKHFPELIHYIIDNLPVMFTAAELRQDILPLLSEKNIHLTLQDNYLKLMNLQGIGFSEYIAKDPLGFRNIVLKKLSHLAPSKEAQFFRGHLLSSDNRNIMIVARPKAAGTDTAFARKATALFDSITKDLKKQGKEQGHKVVLTTVGSFRAALDNEDIARRDTELALLLATIGIALLLLFAFPRPYIGLLSLVPAIAGTMMAFFAYSLLNSSISILAIGFGGGIISITVDHGIAYFLFLDRPHATSGRGAAHEIWSVGILAGLTTVGAFLSLFISGFPILAQIGQFAALGIIFSFIFVHTVFPFVFPEMKAAKSQRTLYMQRFVNKVALGGGKYKALGALLVFIVMLFFAKPDFSISLNAMNTVSNETIKAEQYIQNVWGDVFNKIYVMIKGDTMRDLLNKGDRLADRLAADVSQQVVSQFFIPSAIFPGEVKKRENYKAWKEFWHKPKIDMVTKRINKHSPQFDFAQDAFRAFYGLLQSFDVKKMKKVPDEFFSLLGIAQSKNSSSWMQFSSVTPGKNYNSEKFYQSYNKMGLKIFDANLFAKRLGGLLSATFLKMMLIIGISIILLLFLFFLDIKLTFISILPIVFALIVTLGIMNIMGRKIDIPALMLSIIVLGMGIDYSLYLVCSYQRYRDENSESLGLIRMTVFLAAASTIIGFGVLSMAEHSILKSAGITCLLGIGLSFIGAYAILPPVLKKYFAAVVLPDKLVVAGSKEHFRRVMRRYSKMETHARMFARFKIMLDPMFPRLAELVKKQPKKIIDIGTGIGAPMTWLLEVFPGAVVYGIEPSPERSRVASMVLGERGYIATGKAPDLPEMPGKADIAFMLDMGHYLNNDEFVLTLKNIKAKLAPSGKLVIRLTVPSLQRMPLYRRVELFRMKIMKLVPYYRDEKTTKNLIKKSGLKLEKVEYPPTGHEEVWFVLKK